MIVVDTSTVSMNLESKEGRNILNRYLSSFCKVFKMLFLMDYQLKGCTKGEF